ncbi:MAG TPA: methyltransferase, partial [Actinomycetota bacterium]|nr:methyltransferase [Actinomycetota bacterium]
MSRVLEERVRRILRAGGIENAHQEARWIVAEAVARSDAGDVDGAESAAEGWAARRATGEPLQYVLGEAHFRHLKLEVGPGVFIPRPETESVAGRAIELLPQRGRALDLGTGSGAIALSLATERPDAEVHATEASAEALAWARRNNAGTGEPLAGLWAGDLFAPLPEALRGELDVVV